jgi:hypothetical protein
MTTPATQAANAPITAATLNSHKDAITELQTNPTVLDTTALGGELLAEGDFATHAHWTRSDDFSASFTGGKAVYAHSTGAGSLVQAAADLAETIGIGRWYRIVYTVSSVTAGCVCIVNDGNDNPHYTLNLTAGTHTADFQTVGDANNGDFAITATSSAGGFSLDNLSLKQIGGDSYVGGSITAGGTVSADGFKAGDVAGYDGTLSLGAISGLIIKGGLITGYVP